MHIWVNNKSGCDTKKKHAGGGRETSILQVMALHDCFSESVSSLSESRGCLKLYQGFFQLLCGRELLYLYKQESHHTKVYFIRFNSSILHDSQHEWDSYTTIKCVQQVIQWPVWKQLVQKLDKSDI